MKKILIICLFISRILFAQEFRQSDSGEFSPQRIKVSLFKNEANKRLIIFKTRLQVNTDGCPISYHPYDPKGDSIALNSVLNAVAVYRVKDGIRISNPQNPNKLSRAEKSEMTKEAYKVFELWRDSDYDTNQPKGYNIKWKSVLIEKKNKPCIFLEGKYKGYFVSATTLKNGLTEDLGECSFKNQINPLEIPSIVLAGGENIVKKYGAKIGDFLVAYNAKNKKLVYAIIADSGPAYNLGEGSVLLNMLLLEKTKFPRNRKDTYSYATDNGIIICIIPSTKNYKLEKPYTRDNIKSRILAWYSEQGINSEFELINFIESNKNSF